MMSRLKVRFSLTWLITIVFVLCLGLAFWNASRELSSLKSDMEEVLSDQEAQSRKLLSLHKFPNRAAAIELVNAGGPRDSHHFYRIYIPIELSSSRYVRPDYKICVTIGTKSTSFPKQDRLDNPVTIEACNLAIDQDKESLIAMRMKRDKDQLQLFFNSEARVTGSNNCVTLSAKDYPHLQNIVGYRPVAWTAHYEDEQGGVLLFEKSDHGAPAGKRNVLQVWLQKVTNTD